MRSIDRLDSLEVSLDVSPEMELPTPLRSVRRCPVCGFAELRTDEVAHRGILDLAECPRCQHRSTRPLTATRTEHVRPEAPESAAAA